MAPLGLGPDPEGDRADTYRELFERSADPILIIEGGRFVDCNLATMIMLGYADRDEVLGAHPSELSPPTQPDGRDSIDHPPQSRHPHDATSTASDHVCSSGVVSADAWKYPV